MSERSINIIGGGLAGTEAAFQLAVRGMRVRLFEMRPNVMSPAHKTGGLAELVCSNTFKSINPTSAPGILKSELKELGSLLLATAPKAQVPAGEALAVDREVFSREMEASLLATNSVERIAGVVEDLNSLPKADATIIATGPLTQGKLAETIQSLSGGHGLYFYDAIAPVVDAGSINREIAFAASRYDKGGDDYLNCPMNEAEYNAFYDALMAAQKVEFQDFEEAQYFQGCQPIERIAETGRDSLRFGAMKPVGLTDPRTGRRPHAVVQLRIDNISKSAYNLVGFQTKLKYDEQKRVFRMIPGLEKAEFVRLGSMHRNTYISSPLFLDPSFSLKSNSSVYLAGQITGVEGYTESSTIGLIVAMSIWAKLNNKSWALPPRASAIGSLCHYLFHSDPSEFQPININFGIFSSEAFQLPEKSKKYRKDAQRADMARLAPENIRTWRDQLGWTPAPRLS